MEQVQLGAFERRVVITRILNMLLVKMPEEHSKIKQGFTEAGVK